MMFHKVATSTSLFRQLITTEQNTKNNITGFLLIQIPGELGFVQKFRFLVKAVARGIRFCPYMPSIYRVA